MNDIVTTGEQFEFTSDIIKKRGLIRAKYWSWEEPRNGLITFASSKLLKVLFLTGVNAQATYYNIKIAEVVAGLWEIKYTNDFEHFYRFDGGEPEEDIELEAAVRKIFRGGESDAGNDEG